MEREKEKLLFFGMTWSRDDTSANTKHRPLKQKFVNLCHTEQIVREEFQSDLMDDLRFGGSPFAIFEKKSEYNIRN
jgi:hypothetical protein